MAIFSDRGSTPLISTRINPILEVDWWNTRAEDSVLEALSSVFIFGDNYYATKNSALLWYRFSTILISKWSHIDTKFML